MRRTLPLGALLALLVIPTTAPAAVPHTVQRGETLWSIAAASNLTTRALAAYNGLPADGVAVLGSTIRVPSVAEAAGALATGGPASASTPAATGEPAGDDEAGGLSTPAAAAPPAMGAYTVRAGDTLSEIAARSGVPAGQIAAMNGVPVAGLLPIGTVLKLPTGAPAAAAPASTVPAAKIVPHAAPYPTANRVTAGQIGTIAAAQGVSPSLAAAIGWQESGFNNGAVSGANARGVMQVMPGTWTWIQRNLGVGPLNPFSARDNVRAGSAYLASLLRQTGGNVSQAVAGYYQGLGSVRRVGMYADTQRYVANVLALRRRFGGG